MDIYIERETERDRERERQRERETERQRDRGTEKHRNIEGKRQIFRGCAGAHVPNTYKEG